jgi:hypothetical protein
VRGHVDATAFINSIVYEELYIPSLQSNASVSSYYPTWTDLWNLEFSDIDLLATLVMQGGRMEDT